MAKNRLSKKKIIVWVIIAVIALPFLVSRFEKPIFKWNSVDNPDFKDKPQSTRPLLLEGSSDIGVVLVHGLGATAWETKELAQYLNQKNITTYQVLLAGHGGSAYDLEESTAEKWYQSVEDSLNEINDSKKFIIGSSLGSLLSMEVSQNKNISGIILFSTPIEFQDKRIKYTPLRQFSDRYYHREIEDAHKPFYHENFPIKTLSEMVLYIDKMKMILSGVKTPALIIQSKNDPTVNYESAQYIYDNINSSKKEIMWLNSSRHVIIINYTDENQQFKDERDEAFKKVYNFIIDNSG